MKVLEADGSIPGALRGPAGRPTPLTLIFIKAVEKVPFYKFINNFKKEQTTEE